MTAYQAGTAYVEILPAISGLNAAIRSQLGKGLGDVGEQAGSRIGRNIGRGVSSGVVPAMGLVERSVGRAVGAGTRLSDTFGRVRDGFNNSSAAASVFSGRASSVGGMLRGVSRGVDATGRSFYNMGATVTRVTANMRQNMRDTADQWTESAKQIAPMALAGGILAIGGAMIYAGTQIEQARKTLTGLYGSAKDANYMMGQLARLTKNNPIDYQSYASAAENLAYMGYKGKDAVKIMKNVSDAIVSIGGGSEAMGRVSAAMLKMINMGKVTLDTVDQISDAGVPIFSGLAAHFHTNIANIRTMVTAGKVGIDDVMETIQKAEGKNFAQQKRAAKTTSTSLINSFLKAKNRILLAFGQVGQGLVHFLGPAVATIGSKISAFITSIPNMLSKAKSAMDASGVTAAFQAIGRAIKSVWNGLKPFLGGVLTGLKDGFGGIVKTLGFLAPLFTKIGNWMSSHQGVVRTFGTAVGVLSAAMISLRLASLGATVAMFGWKLVMGGFAPVRAVIGLIRGMRAAMIGLTLAENASIATTVGYKIVQGASAIATGIATAATWLFSAALWATTIPLGIIELPLWAVVLVVGAIIAAIVLLITHWHDVWWGIKTATMWVWNTILKPIFNALVAAVKAVGRWMMWLWRNVIKPVWNAIKAAISWAWNVVIHPVLNAIHSFIVNILAPAFEWFWWNVIKPVWDAISAAISWVWHHVIKPVFDWMHTQIVNAGKAWHNFGKALGDVWSGIKRTFKKGVNAIIGFLNGFVNVINKVTGVFGIPAIPDIPKLATGGVLKHHVQVSGAGATASLLAHGGAIGGGFWTKGPQAIVGEGRSAYPEVVIPTDPQYRGRAMSLYSQLGSKLASDSGGAPQLSIGSWLGGAWDWVSNAASTAWNKVTGFLGDAWNWVTGGVSGVYNSVKGLLAKAVPNKWLQDLAGGGVKKIIGGVIDKLKGFFGGGGDYGGHGGAAPAGMINKWIMSALSILHKPASWAGGIFQQVMSESGGNPHIVQQIHDVNSGGNEARGLMQVIPTTFAAHALPGHGNIYNPVDNLIAAIRYALGRYGASWFNMGPWHSHGYDSGLGSGPLPPGLTMAYNGTRKNEWVMTEDQIGAMSGGERPLIGTLNATVPPGASVDDLSHSVMFTVRHGVKSVYA